jgi:YMGG-like Gly-zipper
MMLRVTLSLCLALMIIASTLLAQPATARTARGALGGAAGGALIGGLAGGGRGAAIGALVGAGTGALIASQGRRSRGRHYWWHGNCYYHGRSGRWYRVSHRYC